MRKELIWAAGVGIFFGLVIAFGVWRINLSTKTKSAATQSSPTPSTTSEFKIALNKPENLDVVNENSIKVFRKNTKSICQRPTIFNAKFNLLENLLKIRAI